ncbi:MAG: AGE family epimerase/isomerase [Lachnospiraceae bacterium]|nr:AGE family epimerase/isomerase [Lachnospiraceae bacterium]
MERKSEFYNSHEKELRRLLRKVREELLCEVVPFWEKRVVDREYPGYLNCFDRQGNLFDGRKPGWFVGRTMYMFASLYNTVEHREEWLDIARAGRTFMDGSFYAGGGRFQQMMSREGGVLKGPVSIFTDHFAVKGLYEYVKAHPREERQRDKELALQLSDALFENVENPKVLASEGIPWGFQKHAVNFMTLLVALESRDLFGERYGEILRKCVEKSLYEFASDRYEAPFEYIGTDGKPKPEGEGRLIDPGHTMEAMWFSMKAGIKCGNTEYGKRAMKILDWVIDRCYDEEYGGFYQHVDLDGALEERFRVNSYAGIPAAWDDKIWWVQAECLYALAMSALYHENERHYAYFLKMYDYVQTHFRDKTYGEWYSILKRDGTVSSDYKGFELKGPYHVPRCLMQLAVLIEEYL